MGKLIRLFLTDDKPDGLRTAEIPNMMVMATLFPRTLLDDFSSREEAKKPGVYMLYGSPLDDNSKPILYIGEGDPVITRLKDHSTKKDFWTEAFVFTSKDGYITKTQIKYLESRLILLAQEADRVQLDNINASGEPTLSEVDRAEVEQFCVSIQVLAKAMRLNFFEPLARPSQAPSANEIVYSFETKGLRGKMAIREGQYVILSGSTASLNHLPSSNNAIKKLRGDLVSNGALIENDQGSYNVVKDIPVNSASYAAAIICGGNYNGLVGWKYRGKTLKEYEELMNH